ncbi:hypothetical protein ARMSODRAFT_1025286 [Armillaria solidipes]|uniref:Protein BNI4 n=1 Tax=Armillaria solidipes TaxID=1076256 RepID=A0A2H3AT71_9AGAR|nr:hypothetical protein ARMSODRAFT_1025286 [Armillaria solidipes]
MAVLAPSDWQNPLRESTMDVPSSNSKQRSPPANDHSPSQMTTTHNQQQGGYHQPQQLSQPYPYPVQQQPQGAWTPSISAQPFYPAFYQNQQQQQPYPQIPQQAPYFDPANAQLAAQWAYHNMLIAQHSPQNFPHVSPPQQHHSSSSQRSGPASPSSNDYFAQNQINNVFNPFPSGTPPPHSNHRGGAGDHPQQQQQQQPNGQYPGFHPYRRPSRQQSQTSEPSDWRSGGVPNPPYARPDASGSTSSVNSSHSSRQRTNSNQSGHSGHNVPSANGSVRSRNGSSAASAPNSARSSPSTSTSPPVSGPQRGPPHNRTSSSSSASSSNRPGSSNSATSPTTATSSAASPSTPRPARPSPLSQGTFTASEKRMSRDDSDLGTMLDPTPSASMLRSGGLKGRLRRALSFNAAQALKEEEEEEDAAAQASSRGSSSKLKPKTPILIDAAVSKPGGGTRSPDSPGDDVSTRAPSTVQTKKKSRAASLFNSRLNASTDNISLSSTVSSASVMIRKLGSMGRLARRNSLAGITSLFKDKEKDKDGDKKGKKKDKKGSAKGEASEASVSHVTAELDRSSSDWNVAGEMSGLSPAAKLARQHTLKSNAEAAAKAKAQQEAEAAANANANAVKVNGSSGVAAWEKNTTTRQGSTSPVKGAGMRVNEDGTKVLVEEDEEDSEDGHYGRQAGPSDHIEGWEDDDDWGEGEEEEDVTIRQGLERVSMDDEYEYQEDPEPWAVDVRRSVERTRTPAKGILKYAASYDQQAYLAEQALPNRVRSNSYNSPPQTELGPLARIPSPDPDHIDGLHRHPSHSSAHGQLPSAPLLPPLTFESSGRMSLDSPREMSSSPQPHAPIPEKASAIFNHPNLNSSAPALSTMTSAAPTLTHRSATAPTSKRLAFASNLSVYDTFSASVYDRRSEPATWSRLTPALAQRIKEELNSYKMEEMEVHAASRIHTQFFV